jgi:glycosyltransferase involved in cell wall biosynthesis
MPAETKKTLIISSSYPLPERTGSRMRTMNFFRYFRKYGAVDLLYNVPESRNGPDSGFFRDIICVPWKEDGRAGWVGSTARFLRRIRRLAERRPYIVNEWSTQAKETILTRIAREEYDFILCRYVTNTLPLFRLPPRYRRRLILDFDDLLVDSLFNVWVKKSKGMIPSFKRSLQRYFLLAHYRKCLGLGVSLFCSNTDLERMVDGKRGYRAFAVPNTYPSNLNLDRHSPAGYPNLPRLLFVGALNYEPNVQGLQWFVDTVLPRLKGIRNDIALTIVGHRPEESLVRRLKGRENIELHGDAADVGRFYEECGAVVVPLLAGGGTRIKILEAAMFGRAVLSTPIGANGLDLADEKEILLFSDAETFVEKFTRLSDRAFYDSIVRNAKEKIIMDFSPVSFEAAMDRVIDENFSSLNRKVR